MAKYLVITESPPVCNKIFSDRTEHFVVVYYSDRDVAVLVEREGIHGFVYLRVLTDYYLHYKNITPRYMKFASESRQEAITKAMQAARVVYAFDNINEAYSVPSETIR